MLKRIRKMNKQKASGKDQEELTKLKEKISPEITALSNERDNLQEEVKNLKELLKNENIRYTELKALKSQQVCALTFKLAKAIRDTERAVEEKETMKQELNKLKNEREELNDLEYHQAAPLDMIDIENNGTLLIDSSRLPNAEEEQAGTSFQLSSRDETKDREIPYGEMSCVAVMDEPIQSNISKLRRQECNQEEVMGDLVDKSCTGGESQDITNSEAASDCSSVTRSSGQSSIKSNDHKKKVMSEFRRIQKELLNVKENMSMVQALNERLSRDLQSLVDKNNTHPLVRSESLRMRKNGSSDANDFVDSNEQENIFVFPGIERIEKDQGKVTSMNDVGRETVKDDLEKTDALEKKNEQQNEWIEDSTKENLEKTPDDEDGRFFAVDGNSDIDREREDNVMDVRKQLEKAMKELEGLRTDNLEMKGQINKIASSSTDHDDFLRRTTHFTSQILREMRERDQQLDLKMTPTVRKVSQPPLSVLGTRLDELTKAVDDKTKRPTPPPLKSVCYSSPIPRPQSAGIPTTQVSFAPVFSREDKTVPKSATDQKKRRFTTGKLGEPSYRHVGRIATEGGIGRPIEPLAKEWRSTEALSPRSSFSRSLGYRDYIERHIVMSSNAIAKIRDLTPEERSAGRIIY